MSLPAVLRRAITIFEGEGARRHGAIIGDLEEELGKLERRQVVKKAQHERRPAVVGEKFVWMEGGRGSPEIELVVREKSPGDEGRWMCISCGVSLAHNLEKDTHCQRGGKRGQPRRKIRLELGDCRARHVLAWRNFVSGFVEVP